VDAAIADFNQAVALSPNYAAAYRGRALAALAKHELDPALADAERAMQIRSDAANLAARGRIREALNQKDAAISDFRAALTIDRNNGDAADGLRRLGAAP
jgi:tetratricopeptide (TPR) repeat protein